MPISRFSFKDELHGWKLNEIAFDDFNLLVGTSGVGKTQILRAIREVVNVGTTEAINIEGCQWMLEIIADGEKYIWAAETEAMRYPTSEEEADNWHDSPELIRETIWQGSKLIVERTRRTFTFDGKTLPKLKTTESAISLLRQESSLAPLCRALSRFVFSEASRWASNVRTSAPRLGIASFEQEMVSQIRQRYSTLNELREVRGVQLLIKAYILQEDHPAEFDKVKEAYAEIFPTVLDVRLTADWGGGFGAEGTFEVEEWLSLGIKEKGVEDWVMNERISAGMLRTLVHLFELALAAPGTVIVVDEVENSMGVNCLPQMTEHFLRHTDLQFILTSHHPYVVNNIPWKYWKLVTRVGSEVTVKDATSIPELDSASSLEKFTQLMNLEEYEEAIR